MPQIRPAVRSWTLPGRAREIHRISRAADDLQVHSGFAVPGADASPRPAGMPGLIQDRVEGAHSVWPIRAAGRSGGRSVATAAGLRRWSTAAPPTVLPLGGEPVVVTALETLLGPAPGHELQLREHLGNVDRGRCTRLAQGMLVKHVANAVPRCGLSINLCRVVLRALGSCKWLRPGGIYFSGLPGREKSTAYVAYDRPICRFFTTSADVLLLTTPGPAAPPRGDERVPQGPQGSTGSLPIPPARLQRNHWEMQHLQQDSRRLP